VPQTDQYALACVAYTMLTGAVPFPREELTAVMWAHTSEPPPQLTALRPDLPPGADSVLARAMAKTADERYGTCAQFAEAFSTALEAGTTAPAAPPPEPPTIPPAIRPAVHVAVPPASPGLPASPRMPASPGLPVSAWRADTVTTLPPASPAHQTGEHDARDFTADTVAADAGEPAADGAAAVAADGGAGGRAAQVIHPRPGRRKMKRRDALIIAAVACVVVAGAGGGVLAAHPWLHPPVLSPAGLTLESATSVSVTFGWAAPVSGPLPDTYEIMRGSTAIASVPGSVTNYTDSGLVPGTAYQYEVIAVRGGKQSPVSQPLTGQTTAPVLQPAGLTVAGRGANDVIIAWSAPAGPLPDTYQIVRNGAVVGSVSGSVRKYHDTKLSPGTAYTYQVIALRDGVRSPVSRALSGHTVTPPLSAARLDLTGNVTYKMESLYPADSKSDRQPGNSWQDPWVLTPRCSSGPCAVTLSGAYDGHAFTSELTRSGRAYSGTAALKGYWECDTPSQPIVGTLTVKVTAESAGALGTSWVVKSFSGTATLYLPAEYTCHDDTAQLSVRSG
jgi:hypothetical protein